MIIFRVTTRFGKVVSTPRAPWHWCVAPDVHSPCRTITAGQHYQKFRNVCEKSKSLDPRLLDPFIGTWVEVKSENFKNFMEAGGVSQGLIDYLLNEKLELTYTKYSDDDWKVEMGYLELPQRICYRLKFGESFHYMLFTGLLTKCVVFQDGNLWRERYESLIDSKVVMTVVNEVNGNTMTSHLEVNDVASKKTFKRA